VCHWKVVQNSGYLDKGSDGILTLAGHIQIGGVLDVKLDTLGTFAYILHDLDAFLLLPLIPEPFTVD